MPEPGTKLQHHRTVFDGWRSISVSLYMALVGYGVLVGMLATGIGNIKVMLSLFSFILLWIFIDVYQMATEYSSCAEP